MGCFDSAAALEWTSSSDRRRLLSLVNRGRHLWKIKTIFNGNLVLEDEEGEMHVDNDAPSGSVLLK